VRNLPSIAHAPAVTLNCLGGHGARGHDITQGEQKTNMLEWQWVGGDGRLELEAGKRN